ncbi:MAG: ABC transporter substrate-binding protein, partial [Phenylobacterium sp.]
PGAATDLVDVVDLPRGVVQQQDFVSTIDNAGGDIGVLIAQLQRDAQRPAAGSR